MKLQELIKKHLNNVIKENEMIENYMFFGNLKQIHRQCELLLKMDPKELDSIIKDGHDWADDHISEAKNNMDQVFDFFMNETQKEDINEEGQLDEKCWDGYKAVGSKMKNGKKVPNCVPVSEASSAAQQAAIAINMKKQGKTPKEDMSEDFLDEEYQIDESKNKPTNPKLWATALAWARSRYDVCPSAYCNGAAAKRYKSKGGGWRKVNK